MIGEAQESVAGTSRWHLVHVIDSAGVPAGAQRVLEVCGRAAEALGFGNVIVTWEAGAFLNELAGSGWKSFHLGPRKERDLSSYWRLSKALRKVGQCVVHGHGIFSGRRAATVGSIMRVPTIVTLHADISLEVASHTRRRLTAWEIARADVVTFVTKAAETAFRNLVRGPYPRMTTIYNGVRANSRTGVRVATGLGLLVVARLSPEKCVHVAIDAMAILRSKGVKAFLRIVGDGPERESLELRARALGMGPDAIEFAGWCTDVASYYAEADALIYTSKWGSLGLALFEAMSAGLVGIAPDQGGARELLVPGENALLYDGTAENLAHVVALMNEKGKAFRKELAQNGMALVRQQLSVEKMQAEYRELYASLRECPPRMR